MRAEVNRAPVAWYGDGQVHLLPAHRDELRQAATSAPMEASFQPMRALRVSATVAPTITSAHSTYTPATAGSSSWAMGVLAPKRYSMQGSAKYSTKALSPGMAGCGSTPRRAAR